MGYLLWKWEAKAVKRGKEKSIIRYEPVLGKLAFDVGHSSWRFALEATDVRHCLIHANGRLDHYTRRHAIEAIVAKYPGEVVVEHWRIKVNPEFVSRFVEEVRSFQVAVKQARGRT